MSMKNKQSGNIVLELIIVLVLVIYGLWLLKHDPVSNSNTNSIANNTANNPNTYVPNEQLNYSQALERYNARRIQLDASCQSSPRGMSVKNGTHIMIDNRSNMNRTIILDTAYNIPAYGFKIVQIKSSALPATWLLDCDNFQNVATILVEK
jgi:hypothetical protein